MSDFHLEIYLKVFFSKYGRSFQRILSPIKFYKFKCLISLVAHQKLHVCFHGFTYFHFAPSFERLEIFSQIVCYLVSHFMSKFDLVQNRLSAPSLAPGSKKRGTKQCYMTFVYKYAQKYEK